MKEGTKKVATKEVVTALDEKTHLTLLKLQKEGVAKLSEIQQIYQNTDKAYGEQIQNLIKKFYEDNKIDPTKVQGINDLTGEIKYKE